MADKKSLSDLGAVLNPTPEPAPVETATEATFEHLARGDFLQATDEAGVLVVNLLL